MTRRFPLWLAFAGLTLMGCPTSTNTNDTTTEADADTDADTDSDTDADGDSDSDSDVFATINTVEPEGQLVSFFLDADDDGKPAGNSELICENASTCPISVLEAGTYWVHAERANYWYVNLPVEIVAKGDEVDKDWTGTGERCVTIDGLYCEDSDCDHEIYNRLVDADNDNIEDCVIGGDGFYDWGAVQTNITFETTFDGGGYNRGTVTEDGRTIHLEYSNGAGTVLTHDYTLDYDNRGS